MSKNIRDITLALAGITQAATLASQIAVTGQCDDQAFFVLINSIFEQNPQNAVSVYHHEAGLRVGLKKLVKLISQEIDQQDRNISRYIMSLMLLERKVSKSKNRLANISKKIGQIRQQSEYFSKEHPTVIANLAQTYLDNISTYSFRIQVIGNPSYVNQEENLNKIRALLLAGIRSAVLWRQVGGNRLHLFFARKKILQTAKSLLNE